MSNNCVGTCRAGECEAGMGETSDREWEGGVMVLRIDSWMFFKVRLLQASQPIRQTNSGSPHCWRMNASVPCIGIRIS